MSNNFELLVKDFGRMKPMAVFCHFVDDPHSILAQMLADIFQWNVLQAQEVHHIRESLYGLRRVVKSLKLIKDIEVSVKMGNELDLLVHSLHGELLREQFVTHGDKAVR